MPICYMLVGCPGSGKSTFVDKHFYDFPVTNHNVTPMLTGTDYYIDRIAEALEVTYSEVFQDAYKLAEKMFWKDIENADEDDIIIDRTNMTINSRKRFINALNSTHRMEAIVFPVPNDLEARLASRTGKQIPANVVSNMIRGFEMPTLSEGFDAVWTPESFLENIY